MRGSQISIIHESNLGKVFVNFVIRVNESLQKSFDAKHASEASRTLAPDDAPKLDVKTIFKQRIFKAFFIIEVGKNNGKNKIMLMSRAVIFLVSVLPCNSCPQIFQILFALINRF